MKPPKMFTEARITARKPMTFEKSKWRAGGEQAPTMITEEMALVTAISGECSAGVTRQTT